MHLACVELDDLLLLEEFREVFALRKRHNLALEVLNVGIEIRRYGGGFVVVHLRDSARGRTVSDFNHVANLELVAGDVHHAAIYQDVAVADHLAGLKDGLRVAKAINRGLQSQLKQAQEVQARVAVHVRCFVERVAELALQHAVVAANNLLSKELLAIFRLTSLL